MATWRNDHAYVTKRNALRRATQRDNGVCWLCGHPFDWTLDWKHPMSFTADHVTPIARGGSMTGDLRPAHRSCNARRGAGRTIATITPPKTTRDW